MITWVRRKLAVLLCEIRFLVPDSWTALTVPLSKLQWRVIPPQDRIEVRL